MYIYLHIHIYVYMYSHIHIYILIYIYINLYIPVWSPFFGVAIGVEGTSVGAFLGLGEALNELAFFNGETNELDFFNTGEGAPLLPEGALLGLGDGDRFTPFLGTGTGAGDSAAFMMMMFT
jgi:hypothetical protein